jgi:hypothetical protein
MNRTAEHRTAWKFKPVLVGRQAERLALLRDAPSIVARMVALGLAKHNPCPPQREPANKRTTGL